MSQLMSSNILQNLYWTEATKITADAEAIKTAQALISGVAAVMDAYDADVVVVNADGNLSAQGRASSLKSVSAIALKQLSILTDPTLQSLAKQIVSASKVLRQAASGPDATVVSELRAQEARAAFANIDPLFQPSSYLTLCVGGEDDGSCVAVENGTGFAQLLNADVIEQGRVIRGARVLPDAAAALNTATELRALLIASVGAARRAMTVAGMNDPLLIASVGAFSKNGSNDDAIDDDDGSQAAA